MLSLHSCCSALWCRVAGLDETIHHLFFLFNFFFLSSTTFFFFFCFSLNANFSRFFLFNALIKLLLPRIGVLCSFDFLLSLNMNFHDCTFFLIDFSLAFLFHIHCHHTRERGIISFCTTTDNFSFLLFLAPFPFFLSLCVDGGKKELRTTWEVTRKLKRAAK